MAVLASFQIFYPSRFDEKLIGREARSPIFFCQFVMAFVAKFQLYDEWQHVCRHYEMFADLPPPRSTSVASLVHDLAANVVQFLHPLPVSPPPRLCRGDVRSSRLDLNPRSHLPRFVHCKSPELAKEVAELLPQLVGARVASEQLLECGSHQDRFRMLGHELVICIRQFNKRKYCPQSIDDRRACGVCRIERDKESQIN